LSSSVNPVFFKAGITGKDFQEQGGLKGWAPETDILNSVTHQAEKRHVYYIIVKSSTWLLDSQAII
jgi:hypothetical protein